MNYFSSALFFSISLFIQPIAFIIHTFEGYLRDIVSQMAYPSEPYLAPP